MGQGLVWKRNVQSAKNLTPRLILNQSIAVMLALRKLAKQSKPWKWKTGKSVP
jgi:hypothetical protein